MAQTTMINIPAKAAQNKITLSNKEFIPLFKPLSALVVTP